MEDPFEDPDGLCVPSRSPSPNRDVLESDRMCLDEELADEKALTVEAIDEEFKEKEARAQATVSRKFILWSLYSTVVKLLQFNILRIDRSTIV